MDDLYLDTIIDRYKHPEHKGKIEHVPEGMYTEKLHAHNTSCGDQFDVELLVDNATIVAARWQGEGCAISTVSTDMFCEWAIGKTQSGLEQYSQTDIQKLSGIDAITPAREKCLYIPLRFTLNISS